MISWEPQFIDEGLMQRGREVEHRYQWSRWDSLIVGGSATPALLVDDLNMEIAGLREAIGGLEDDLDMLAEDKRVKKWLAVIRRERRSTVSFGVAF